MKTMKQKLTAGFIIVFFAIITSGCGYILHPQRRGRGGGGGKIDPITVVFDCLWLLAGIIPGVVALIVDGVSGTWYYGPGEKPVADNTPGNAPVPLVPGQKTVLQIRHKVAARDRITVQLVDHSGRVTYSAAYTTPRNNDLIPVALQIHKQAEASQQTMVLAVNGKITLKLPVSIK